MWFKNYQNTSFDLWLRVHTDPHDKMRGFSIKNREMKVEGFEPVEDTMRDLRGHTMPGKFWVVKEDEVMRSIPELRKHAQQKAWFFPVEFCEAFVRPKNYRAAQVLEHKLIWED